MKNNLCMICLIAFFIFVSCSNKGKIEMKIPKDITEYNLIREKVNLLSLSSDWQFQGKDQFEKEVWKRSKKMKIVQRNSTGKIKYEIDYYYSGKQYNAYADTYHEGKRMVDEYFMVQYNYEEKNYNISYSGNNSEIKAYLKDIPDRNVTRNEVSRMLEKILPFF